MLAPKVPSAVSGVWAGAVSLSHRLSWFCQPTTAGPVEPRESALAEYPVKVEDGVVYVDTEGVSPLFAPP